MTPIPAPPDDATARFDAGGFEWGLELIQVPDVGPIPRKPSSIEAWESEWADRSRSRRLASHRRPRRRLRREIRVAACVCLAIAPIVTAVGAWGFPPARRAAAAEVAASVEDEGREEADRTGGLRIRLSIKPLGAIEAEPENPVVFPGYLLPAERREEASYEGS